MTFAARMQHLIYWGWLKVFLEWSLKTWLAPWAYVASVIYHDSFWYPLFGRSRLQAVMRSPWGHLFQNWESLTPSEAGYPHVGEERRGLVRGTIKLLWMALKILGTCIREAPEAPTRRRRRSTVRGS